MRHHFISCVVLSSDVNRSHNALEVALNLTMETASIELLKSSDGTKSLTPFEMKANRFQVQNSKRSKRDMFDWIGQTVQESINWVSNATDAVNWIDYIAGADIIKWIGRADNGTSEWVAQTAIDRDVWIYNRKNITGNWTDDVPIETSKWSEGNVYHCFHKFIIVQVIVATNSEAVGGVMQGGPNGAAAKAVEHCVKSVLKLKNDTPSEIDKNEVQVQHTNELIS